MTFEKIGPAAPAGSLPPKILESLQQNGSVGRIGRENGSRVQEWEQGTAGAAASHQFYRCGKC